MLLLRFSLLAIALPLLAQRGIPVDNEFVRVLSVVDQPSAKPGAVHEHKENRVMIYIDPADIMLRYTQPSEHKDEDQHWKAGDVAWSPLGGLHTSQHTNTVPARIIEIELKKPASGTPAAKQTSVAAKDVIIDKPQVLVYRSATMPAQGNYVAVNMKTAETTWNHAPSGTGPFVVTLLK
jgi:hypothetical protein